MSIEFKPSYISTQLFDYSISYGHQGKNQFHGSYDQERYYKFLDYVKSLGVDSNVWPYYNIEEDFYTFNSMGYRTYEFDDLGSGTFDLALGCSYVEGLGLRQSETWLSHYEHLAHTRLVNLGKGGGSNTLIKLSLLSWLSGSYPKPRKIIVLWTEPSRDTFVREGGSFVSLNPGWNEIHHLLYDSDNVINTMYQTSLRSNVMWSNRFVDLFTTVNLLAKSLSIPLYNFFPDLFWTEDDLEKVKVHTNFTGHLLKFDNVSDGWMDFKGTKIHPAADGVHHGPQHQLPIAKNIFKVTNEEN